jgi:predicted acylesterase/phospholipase RssA
MKPKHVFILGGGAALGAYPIGARRFLEERGVRPVRAAAPRKHA